MGTGCQLIGEKTLMPIKPADFGARWCEREAGDGVHPKRPYRQQRIVAKIDAPALTWRSARTWLRPRSLTQF